MEYSVTVAFKATGFKLHCAVGSKGYGLGHGPQTVQRRRPVAKSPGRLAAQLAFYYFYARRQAITVWPHRSDRTGELRKAAV